MTARWMDRILRRYGQAVLVETATGTAEAAAFLQPVAETAETAREDMTAIGWTDGRLWRYVSRTAVAAGDTVCFGGHRFRVRSGRSHYLGQEIVCCYGVLEEEREAAKCGS